MILPNLAKAAMGLASKSGQKKSTAVGSVPPHSHDSSKDTAAPVSPVGNITGNANQNAKIEELGKKFFQGDQFANQYASRPPVDPAMPIPPQPDPIGDQYGDMFMQPFSKKVEAKLHKQKPALSKPKGEQFKGVNFNGDPKGRPYVVNKEKTGTSRDTLFLPQNTYVSKNGYAEDSVIDNAARKAAAKGIYDYTGGKQNFNFEYLEESGKVKYKK